MKKIEISAQLISLGGVHPVAEFESVDPIGSFEIPVSVAQARGLSKHMYSKMVLTIDVDGDGS